MLRLAALVALLSVPSQSESPLDFRCDGMEVLKAPNRTICRGNVVARQADLVICCDQCEAVADKAWQWTSLRCQKDVRAQRGDELMWSESAQIDLEASKIMLTGQPLIERGMSLLSGSKITVTLSGDHALVDNPRGSVATPSQNTAIKEPKPLFTGALPATCPIPKAPSKASP